MDSKEFLREICALPGLPGHESRVADYVKRRFEPLSDDVRVDALQNVIARYGQGGPRVMLAAHQDEIGLAVLAIEKDGAIRMARNGGVDPRILPAADVTVWTKSGPLFGVVGAKAPHLLTDKERKQSITLDNVHVDVGLPADAVRARVRVGDMITLTGPLTELSGGVLAGKTMDDRAGVACMLCALEELKRLRAHAEVYFVASTQEEVGTRGAKVAAHSVSPDIAIAIDVTHGEGPGTGKYEAFPLNKVVLDKGPIIHPELLKRLQKTAERHHIDVQISVSGGATWTDADAIQTAREGIPTVLVAIPLKYMHTTVETLLEQTIEEAGRLIAYFIDDISRDWEAITWY